MTEREKVIKGLECCADSCRYGCPYNDIDQDCQGVLCMDALALLKAQEPVEPTWRRGYAYCGKCGFKLHWIVDKNNYCPECGRAVKWQ